MRRTIVISVLLLASVTSSADVIRFEPLPDSRTPVVAKLEGIWPDGAVPTTVNVTISGNRIELRFPASSIPGPQILTPYRLEKTIGLLAPGVHEVLVFDAGSRLRARERLVIRGVSDAFRLAEPVVPDDSGVIGIVPGEVGRGALAVEVGGQPARIARTGELLVELPRLTPGLHEITIIDSTGRHTIRGALYVFSPAEPPDAVSFEPILFPLIVDVPGAFGTRWRSDALFINQERRAYTWSDLSDVACDVGACRRVIGPGSVAFFAQRNAPEGRLVWVTREAARRLKAFLNLQELSRPDTATQIPVARERDFSNAPLKMVVPVRPNGRLNLRVYALAVDSGMLPRESDRVSLSGTGLQPAMIELRRNSLSPDAPLFANVNLSTLITDPTRSSVTLTITPWGVLPIWAMVSITDNASQQVTIISPQ